MGKPDKELKVIKKYALVADIADSYAINDHLYWIFLEDVNRAVDVDLYAEMIKTDLLNSVKWL